MFFGLFGNGEMLLTTIFLLFGDEGVLGYSV
jgi:hypothetical protein